MTAPDQEITLSPAPAPAFMADTTVRELLGEDGTVRAYELSHPSGITVTSVKRETAERSLAGELERRAAAEEKHGPPSGASGLEQARTGVRYRVSFDDCCIQGSFVAAVERLNFDGGMDVESVLFSNGVTLSGYGARLEETED